MAPLTRSVHAPSAAAAAINGLSVPGRTGFERLEQVPPAVEVGRSIRPYAPPSGPPDGHHQRGSDEP